LENHFNRKTSCIKNDNKVIFSNIENVTQETDLSTELNQIITETNNINKCKYCNKNYSRNDSLIRHIKKNLCKIKKELNDVYMTEIETLKTKLIEHSNKLKEINVANNNNNLGHTNIVQNNHITNNVNVNIVSIGNEDISKLTQKN
jgi:hypothetical protein